MNARDKRSRSAGSRGGFRRPAALGAALVALLLAVAVLGGCAQPKPNTVRIHDLEFDPQTITVSPGTTVTWVVQDETAHIIQTDDYQAQGKDQTGQFTSKPLNPGESFSHTFSTPGKFPYSDPLQGYMTGTVIVQ